MSVKPMLERLEALEHKTGERIPLIFTFDSRKGEDAGDRFEQEMKAKYPHRRVIVVSGWGLRHNILS